LTDVVEFYLQNSKIAFCATLGDVGVTYTVHVARWKARGRLPISTN